MLAASAESGPPVFYGVKAPGAQPNTDQGPGAINGDLGLLDPRVGYNGTRKGWISLGSTYRRCLSQVPAAAVANNIAPAAHAVNGTPMVLAGASTGITVIAAPSPVVWASGNAIAVGALVLDGLPGLINYGLADSNGNYRNNAYDNGKALARAVAITGVLGGSGGHFLVSGADLYGYPQTENINATAGATTTNGKKTWKFIYSVTPLFSDANNYEVGTADIFGFPLKTLLFDQVFVWWNSALITANTGYTAADTTSPATSTTGDVRGTYAVQSASDGTKRLTMAVGIPESTNFSAVGAFGVTPA